MVRENWRSLEFWHWWWGHRFPTAGKVALLALLVAAVLGVGYFAATSVAGTGGSAGDSSYVVVKTVRRLVAVKRNGRVVVRTVPVTVSRTIVKPRTSLQTVVETQLVRHPVVHYVPVVRSRTVTVNGKRQVVTETRMVPTVKTETQVKTQTSVVTTHDTVPTTVDHTTTNTSTVHDTTTQHATTTQHDTTTQTVHDTTTQTVTDTQTVHDTTTQTVTSPPETVTVTVTTPLTSTG